MNRVVRIAGGSTLVVAGTAMLVLPGPGILTIAAGVALLSEDFGWAKRLKGRLRSKAWHLDAPRAKSAGSHESGRPVEPDQPGG